MWLKSTELRQDRKVAAASMALWHIIYLEGVKEVFYFYKNERPCLSILPRLTQRSTLLLKLHVIVSQNLKKYK